LSMALSSSASASNRLSLLFSCSTYLRRLASVAYGLRPTASTCLRRAAASGDTSLPTPLGLGTHRERSVLSSVAGLPSAVCG
jgi:hypothetical protein